MNKFIYFLFALVGVIQLYTAFFFGEYPQLQFWSKISLMPILLLAVLMNISHKKSVLIWLVFALIFSTIGDYFLILDNSEEIYFMLGLGSFLLAQVSYGVSFIRSKEQNFEVPLIYKAPVYMVLILLSGVFVYVYLKPGMGDMDLPVFIYLSAILFMTLMALNRFKKVPDTSFWLVMIGALIFMLSDSVLAFNKFNALISNVEFYIMLTYLTAQFLIVYGSILDAKKSN